MERLRERKLKWLHPYVFEQELEGERVYRLEGAPVDLAAAKYFDVQATGPDLLAADPVRDPLAQELPSHILQMADDWFAPGGPLWNAVTYGVRICNLKRVWQEMNIVAQEPDGAHISAKIKKWLIAHAWEKEAVRLSHEGESREITLRFHASGKVGIEDGPLRRVKQTQKGYYLPIKGKRWYFDTVQGVYLPYSDPRFPGNILTHNIPDYHLG